MHGPRRTPAGQEAQGLRTRAGLKQAFGRGAESAHRRSQERNRTRGRDARRQAIVEERGRGRVQALGASPLPPLGKSGLSINAFLGVFALRSRSSSLLDLSGFPLCLTPPC